MLRNQVPQLPWLGKPVVSEIDEFPENFRRGGGVISDPKKFVEKFLAFETPIWGGHFRSKNFRSKKSLHFSQKRPGGTVGQDVDELIFENARKERQKEAITL